MTEKAASFRRSVSGFINRLINGSPDHKTGPVPAGNTATGVLKLIALIFMFIDHSGKVLFSNNADMRLLGRLAFPLYIWCMIVGFHRTRNPAGYMLRILLVGLISQPLYVLALDFEGHIGLLLQNIFKPLSGTFSWEGLWTVMNRLFLTRPNIFLTLALGLAAIWGIREKKLLSQFWAPAAAVVLATVLNADYGWVGVVAFIVIYGASGTRSGIAAVMVSYFLFWGYYLAPTGHIGPKTAFSLYERVVRLEAYHSTPLKAFLHASETFGLLSLPLILIRFPRDLRMPRWVGYSLYPGHLILLILLKIMMFGWAA